MFQSAECIDAGALGGPPLAVVVVGGLLVVVGAVVVVGLAVVVVVAGLDVVVVVEEPPPLQAATSDNATMEPTTRIHGASLFVTMLLSLLSILTCLPAVSPNESLRNTTRWEAA